MTFRQLEIFIVVARTLNLRAASQELHIAQSSISHHLKLLHRELGKQLHKKVGSGIELTAAGTLFLKQAPSIISRIEGLRAKIHSQTSEPVQSALTVGGSLAASAKVLPQLMAEFKKSHENVRLKLQAREGLLLDEMVLSGEVDVGLVHHKPMSRQLAAELYSNDSLVACVGAKHPLAKKRRLSQDDMQYYGFVALRPLAATGKAYQFAKSLEQERFAPKVVMECDSAEAKRNAVKNQIGIGLFLEWSVRDELKNGELVEIGLPGTKLTRDTYIIYHKARPLSPPARDFLELLQTHRDVQKQKGSS
jgi:DNA-binding transcriptional LysR family regulator